MQSPCLSPAWYCPKILLLSYHPLTVLNLQSRWLPLQQSSQKMLLLINPLPLLSELQDLLFECHCIPSMQNDTLSMVLLRILMHPLRNFQKRFSIYKSKSSLCTLYINYIIIFLHSSQLFNNLLACWTLIWVI